MDAYEHGEKTGIENMNGLSYINPAFFAQRKRGNIIGVVLCTAAMVLGMAFLLWILRMLFI